MALPAPNLDDRRFQDLVDDAKRMVMRKCPEWTDHNVSDPGVTLIETFAYMTDLTLFRLNRVPDRLFVKFLDLLGLQLFTAQPARVQLTFWLSAPATTELHIPVGTRTATVRTEVDDSLIFTTVDDLAVVQVSCSEVGTRGGDPEAPIVLRNDQLAAGAPFPAFAPVPEPGDHILFALDEAAPSNAVALRFECSIEGVGVDPDNPPIVWEAWTGDDWTECETEYDSTGGLNREGEIVIHVVPGHVASVIEGVRAGWIRARVIEDSPNPYSSSPLIESVEAFTIGGTCAAVQAELVEGEVVGESDGTAGQTFTVRRGPIVRAGAPPIVETTSDDGWVEWEVVADPYGSTEDDRHVVIDDAVGEIRFGPALREQDGHVRQLGAVPDRGSSIRIRQYYVGAGAAGNVAAGAVRTLKSSIPFVARVSNRSSATGGVDAETIENAKLRAPLQMRTRSRAVTAEDFELLTREAAPEVVRVRCAAIEDAGAGMVRILIVPAAPIEDGRIEFADLIPRDKTLELIEERLESARLVGTSVQIEPPTYQGVTIVARLRAAPRADAARVQRDAVQMLHEYFNPLTGGPDGSGWPWGHPVQRGDAFAVLQRVEGVGVVEEVLLFGANPVTGERGDATERLTVGDTSLVFSYEHQIRVDDD